MKLPTRQLASIWPSHPARTRAGVRALVGQPLNRLETRRLLALFAPAATSPLPATVLGAPDRLGNLGLMPIGPVALSTVTTATLDTARWLDASPPGLAPASPGFLASSTRPWTVRLDRIALDPKLQSLTVSQPLSPIGPGVEAPPPGGRAQISEATVLLQGTPTIELAVANDQLGTVTVIQGNNPVLAIQGLANPEAVKLADLNNDGTPDLIVADSDRNKVLVYPGLAGGGFGPEVTGGVGYSVGLDPVGLTVADLGGNGFADLIVANKGSNDVSILESTGTGNTWTLTPKATVKAGLGPFKTVIADPGPGAAGPLLVICNSISSDAYIYPISPGGQVAAVQPTIVPVGPSPNDMFVGHYSHESDLDLVTLDAGSDKATYIGGVFTPHPIQGEIATGLTGPITATSLPPDSSGASDLIVANSSGQIAFLQASAQGLVLTGLSSPTGLTNVSAIAAGETTNGVVSIFEASNSADTVAVLQFNLGDLSPFQAVPPADLLSSIGGGNDSLTVEMVPSGSQMLDLVGLLRNGSSSSAADQLVLDQVSSRSRINGQGASSTIIVDVGAEPIRAASREGTEEEILSGGAAPSWTRFVLGLDAALDSFRGEVGALAAADAGIDEPDQSSGRFVVNRIGPTPEASPFGPREGHFAAPTAPGTTLERNETSPSRPGLSGFWMIPGGDRRDSASRSSDLTTATLGSVLAVRFLINASPPKPPRPPSPKRSRPALVRGPWVPWPEALPPMDPHG